MYLNGGYYIGKDVGKYYFFKDFKNYGFYYSFVNFICDFFFIWKYDMNKIVGIIFIIWVRRILDRFTWGLWKKL